MSKEEPRQQQPPATTAAEGNSVSNQLRHQQTTVPSLNHHDHQITKQNSNTALRSGPHQASSIASSAPQSQNNNMAMHNFGQNSVNQQDQLKNQPHESPWHVNSKSGTNNNTIITNNNNNLGDLQPISKSTTSPSSSAFDNRHQPNLQSQHQQYGLPHPQLPPSLQSSLASRVDQIIRNTLHDSPAYTPPTSNNNNHHNNPMTSSHNSMPSPSSASMMMNQSTSITNFSGQPNIHVSNSGVGLNPAVSMSPLISFHGSAITNIGDTNGNLLARTPAHSASHSSLAAGSVLQNQAHLQRPQQLAHSHQPPFSMGTSRSPSTANNHSSTLTPQAAHGNNYTPKLGITSTTSSDHHNHIHIPNSTNQSDHIADFTSKIHTMNTGQQNVGNKMPFLPPSRHPFTMTNWQDHMSQANNDNLPPRLPMPHGINTSISQQLPPPASTNPLALAGASSSSMATTSNSNPMIGHDSDNLLRLNATIRNDHRITGLAGNFMVHEDGRGLHTNYPGPFAKQSYPGLEHFKVPIAVAETAFKVQLSQQRSGTANCIPETVAIFALNLTGTNIPGTNKPKRVVVNDNEMRTSIEHGELYSKHESVVIGILTNQVHVPGFNIADYLSRDKFTSQEMEKIENIHSRIDPYQLICLMEFIRYRYPPRSKVPTTELNKTSLPHQTSDPPDFRPDTRDLISNTQQMSAPRTISTTFPPMLPRYETVLSQFDKSRLSSQSPSDTSRSQFNVNASRPLPVHLLSGGPNSSHPMVSLANNPLMPSPYASLNQQQKSSISHPQLQPPMNRSSPFQPPMSVGSQFVTRPPRSHSTIGGLGIGTFDAPVAMNAPTHIRQPPAAHQSSSRPNLPCLNLSTSPAHCFNPPVAAHMSSKIPQTPRIQESPGKSNLKNSPHAPTYSIKHGNKSQLPSMNHIDQLGSPTKHSDYENASGLPMQTLLALRQQDIANRDLALRRSVTPHFNSQSLTGPLGHPGMLGPRGFESARLDLGPRSPSQMLPSHLGNPDMYRPSGGSYSSGMPPPNTSHSRPHDINKLSNSLPSTTVTANDAQLRQYSTMMSAFQNQNLNLLPNKSPDSNVGNSNTSQQNSPGQIFQPISSGTIDHLQLDIQQRPPPISPKQASQRSIITGSASTSKKGKKSKPSPPINVHPGSDNKNTNHLTSIETPPAELSLKSSFDTSSESLSIANISSSPTVGHVPNGPTDTSNPDDQLSQLAAAAAAAAPAVSSRQPADDSSVPILSTLSVNNEMLPLQMCAGETSARDNKIPTSAATSDVIAPSLEYKANNETSIVDNFNITADGFKNDLNKNTAFLNNVAGSTGGSIENTNTESVKELSKYQKLFTKKAWIKNYDQEDQAKTCGEVVDEKMALKTKIDNIKEVDESENNTAKDIPKSNQSGNKTNGSTKSSKSPKVDSKKKSKVNRDKSSSLSSLKTNRVASSKSIENDSEETTASTSDLDDTTDEADSMKSTGDKKLRRMPGRKVKINPDREPNQANYASKSKLSKDVARKRVKKDQTAIINTSDNDSTPVTVVKRKYNSDDEGTKQKTKKIKDSNGKVWDKIDESPSKLKKRLGDKFLQICPCYDIVPKNIRCMECRRVRQSSLKGDKLVPSKQTSRTNWDDFCRFYQFRKLRYNKSDQIVVAGFSEMGDAKDSDKQIWLPNATEIPGNFNYNVAKFILSNVGSEFCNLVLQERAVQEAYKTKSEDKKITWKRAVNGLRELCDVCSTTLFNSHFVCERCGFVVCIDCHQHRAKQQLNDRKEHTEIKKENSPLTISENIDEQTSNNPSKKSKKDATGWIYCAKNEEHSADRMILAQIIAGDCLEELWTMLHETRIELNIGPCPCMKRSADSKISFQRTSSTAVDAENDTDSEGSHSTLKGLLLASQSSTINSIHKDDKQFGSVEETGIEVETSTSPKATVINSRVFDFSNEDDSQDDSRQVSAAIEECIASLSAKGSEERPIDVKPELSGPTVALADKSIYTTLCDGDLIVLNQPRHRDNIKIFKEHWKLGKPVLVRGVHKLMSIDRWLPQFFAVQFGDYRSDLVDCRNGDIHRQSMKKYWDGFEPSVVAAKKKNKDDAVPSHIPSASNEEPSAITTTYYCGSALWRLKDWPPGQDFNEILPDHYNDFMNNLPLKSYTTRTGRLNLACRLPKEMVKPDLGPKMYSAYGTTKFPERGTTNLHLDICDAVNVMVYVGGASAYNSGSAEFRELFEKTIDETHIDDAMKSDIRRNTLIPGALWHIFKPSDACKMREFLDKVADERKISPEKRTDPIHDQIWYLDQSLLDRLYQEYGVKSYPILQCMGDAILIPAGAPHQVKNLQNCIKVANDFVSPENVHWCLKLTDEFRKLPETHINQEDKLQIKNILYHCVKESLQYLKMSKTGKVNPTTEETDSDDCEETDAEKTESESDSNGNNANPIETKKTD